MNKLKFVKFYEEKINPKEFNAEFEDPEDEEDAGEIDTEVLDDVIGGTVYRATFKFVRLNTKTGAINSTLLNELKNATANYYWGRGNRFNWPYTGENLYDIEIEVRELKIDKIDKRGSFIMLPQSGPNRRYSMKATALFKGNNLSTYYVRPNDVLSFDMKGVSEGLMVLLNKNRDLIRWVLGKVTKKVDVEKKISDAEKKLKFNTNRKKEIQFLLDNLDKVKSYIPKNKLDTDMKTVLRSDIIAQNIINDFKNYKHFDVINNEKLLKKIEDLKKK